MGQDSGDPAPSGHVLLRAAPRAAEPSWGGVLATTVKLSVARRWRMSTAALAAALVAVAVLWFAGVLSSPAAPAARASAPAARVSAPAARVSATTSGTSSAGALARSRAAAWIAGQISGYAIIACYPDMCAALQAQGVMAGRLMPLRTAAASPLGAGVLVTSPSVHSRLAEEYAPAVIASFGSGDTRVDVRAAEPGGVAAYQAARRADLDARRSAGSQLLQNRRLEFTARDAGQLRAGEVDARLLATLAALASQHSFRVTAFADASPDVPLLFRAATLTSSGNGTTALAAAAALVRAQAPPYLPAHATIARLATGRPALIIEFSAPSPLGLLTAVL